MAKYVWLDSLCQWKLKGHAWPDRDFILVNPCFVQFSIIFYPSPLAYALLLCRYLQAEIIKTTKHMTTVNKKFKQRSSVKEDVRQDTHHKHKHRKCFNLNRYLETPTFIIACTITLSWTVVRMRERLLWVVFRSVTWCAGRMTAESCVITLIMSGHSWHNPPRAASQAIHCNDGNRNYMDMDSSDKCRTLGKIQDFNQLLI